MFLKIVRHYCGIKHTIKKTACKYIVRFTVAVQYIGSNTPNVASMVGKVLTWGSVWEWVWWFQ